MANKLLLADDSVTIQRVIELTFSGEDVEVLAVGDGEEAIARIPIEKPDIVLADIGMPKRSGYDVSAFVKGHPDFAHIPVLLLAGAFEPVDDLKALEVRCDGVLVKPFEPQHVVARVRELILGAKGSPTQRAVADVARPVERLAPFKPVELPTREGQSAISDDLIDLGDAELDPPGGAASTVPDLELNGSLDDYFDRLDEAFSSISGLSPAPGASASGDRPELELESLDGLVEASVSPRAAASRALAFAGVDSDDAFGLPTLDDLLSDVPAFPATSAADAHAVALPALLADEPFLSRETGAASIETLDMPFVEPAHPVSPSSGAVRTASPLDSTPNRSILADAFTALLAVEQGEPGAVPVRLNGNHAAPVVTEALVDDVAQRVSEKLALGTSEQVTTIVRQTVLDVAERLVREEIARIRGNNG